MSKTSEVAQSTCWGSSLGILRSLEFVANSMAELNMAILNQNYSASLGLFIVYPKNATLRHVDILKTSNIVVIDIFPNCELLLGLNNHFGHFRHISIWVDLWLRRKKHSGKKKMVWTLLTLSHPPHFLLQKNPTGSLTLHILHQKFGLQKGAPPPNPRFFVSFIKQSTPFYSLLKIFRKTTGGVMWTTPPSYCNVFLGRGRGG